MWKNRTAARHRKAGFLLPDTRKEEAVCAQGELFFTLDEKRTNNKTKKKKNTTTQTTTQT